MAYIILTPSAYFVADDGPPAGYQGEYWPADTIGMPFEMYMLDAPGQINCIVGTGHVYMRHVIGVIGPDADHARVPDEPGVPPRHRRQ